MASLSLQAAFSLSSATSSVRIPASTKRKPCLAISRIGVPSTAILRTQQVKALPLRGQGFKSHCVSPASPAGEEEEEETTAIPTVLAFYQGLNRKDIKAVTHLFADNCVLNDSQFPRTFEGKNVVLKFVKDLVEAMGKDITFVVEEVSEGDDLNVIVLWHLEYEGKALPLTKGCSFYHCEEQGERIVIRFVQDFMEPPLKPGYLILKLLKTISSLFKQSPYFAQKLLRNPYYVFGGVIAIYMNYVYPIVWPFLNPFIRYYRMIIKSLFKWITFMVNIVIKIIKFFGK